MSGTLHQSDVNAQIKVKIKITVKKREYNSKVGCKIRDMQDYR